MFNVVSFGYHCIATDAYLNYCCHGKQFSYSRSTMPKIEDVPREDYHKYGRRCTAQYIPSGWTKLAPGVSICDGMWSNSTKIS